MSDFARINSNNKVVDVVFVPDEIVTDDENNLYEHWAFTYLYEKYPNSEKDYWVLIDNKKNNAYLHDTFDKFKNGFIPNKPYASWTFNEESLKWKSPVEVPILTDDEKAIPTQLIWNETNQTWDKITS
jgi:hypothetical protein